FPYTTLFRSKALPITEANSARALEMPSRRSHPPASCAEAPHSSASGDSSRASPPVATPVSSDQSRLEMSGRRSSQRALPTEYADHDASAPTAQMSPATLLAASLLSPRPARTASIATRAMPSTESTQGPASARRRGPPE